MSQSEGKHHRILCECFLVLIVLVSAACQAAQASSLVEQVCLQHPDYQFCETTLNGNRETADADRYKLAAIAFQMAYLDAKGSLQYIDNLLKDTSGPSQDPIIRGHLEQCRGYYDDATRKFGQASNDINSETYDLLGNYSSAAIKDANDCWAAFGRTASPLDNNNRNLKGYAQIGVAVAKLFV